MHMDISQGNFCAVKVTESPETTWNEHRALTPTVRTCSGAALFGELNKRMSIYTDLHGFICTCEIKLMISDRFPNSYDMANG